jgi:hypothetical protein
MGLKLLTHRTQTVTSGSNVSTQGCILSIILFSMYVETMKTTLYSFSILKYTDDTIEFENIYKGETYTS